MTGYYDYVLGLIPLTLVGLTALFYLSGVSLTTAVPMASSVPVALIGHALFINGPVDPGVSSPAHGATQQFNAE